MLFSAYFVNYTTGEVVARRQRGLNDYKARRNFQRFLRRTNTLNSGDAYRIVLCSPDRSLDDIPENLHSAHSYQVAR